MRGSGPTISGHLSARFKCDWVHKCPVVLFPRHCPYMMRIRSHRGVHGIFLDARFPSRLTLTAPRLRILHSARRTASPRVPLAVVRLMPALPAMRRLVMRSPSRLQEHATQKQIWCDWGRGGGSFDPWSLAMSELRRSSNPERGAFDGRGHRAVGAQAPRPRAGLEGLKNRL